jgi:hypothetical protein
MIRLMKVDEEAMLSKSLMTKKTKRLYGRMQHGIRAKKEAIDRLETKRQKLENLNKSSKR